MSESPEDLRLQSVTHGSLESVESQVTGRRSSQGKRVSQTGNFSKTPSQDLHAGDQPAYLARTWIGQQAYHLVQIPHFEYFFYGLIVLNAMEMGFALAYDDWEDIWICADVVFAALFCFETMMTLLAYGHLTFCNFWHCLQLFSTLAALGDCWMSLTDLGKNWSTTSRTMKSSRLLLMAKLFSMNRETKLIVYSMGRSLTALRGVLVVILVLCYGCTLGIYSIVGLKGDVYDERGILFGEQPHAVYFGSITRTMLTLFSILILSEWDSVARAVYEVQPYVVCFFIGFTVFLTFGLMNVLVGIIVDTVNNIHREHDEAVKEEQLKRQQEAVEQVIHIVFGDDDEITLDEFLGITEDDDQIAQIMTEFKVPYGFTFGDLFSILDDDKDGQMSKGELSDGLFSLMAGGDTARFCIAELHVSRCHYDIVQTKKTMDKMAATQEALVQRLDRLSTGSVAVPPFRTNPVPTVVCLDASMEAQKMASFEKAATNGGLWSKCYSNLHETVQRHCKEELDQAWETLQLSYRSVASKEHPQGTDDLSNEEHFVIRKKLHHAVCKESGTDLRKAIEHATSAGIDSTLLAMELTYSDALKRFKCDELPTTDVKNAMESGDWSSALDMIVESSLTHGADKSILAHLITRVSADSVTSSTGQSYACDPTGSFGFGNRVGSTPTTSQRSGMGNRVGSSPTSSANMDGYGNGLSPEKAQSREGTGIASSDPSVQGRAGNVRKFPGIRTKGHFQDDSRGSDPQLNLLSILHFEASKHSGEEMSKAWEAVAASKKQGDIINGKQDPLSQSEESFYVYNLMHSAVQRKSFYDLQRALHQAIVAGLDIRDMDAEVAYRDALARFNKNTAYTVRLAVDAFRRKEWYLALDLVLQISLARGADRLTLLRTLTKIYANVQQTKKHTWV